MEIFALEKDGFIHSSGVGKSNVQQSVNEWAVKRKLCSWPIESFIYDPCIHAYPKLSLCLPTSKSTLHNSKAMMQLTGNEAPFYQQLWSLFSAQLLS